jgi:hypothetical protein
LIINELDADTTGSDTLEFVELLGDPNMSLDGLSMVGVNGSDGLTYDTWAVDLDGFTTDSNGFFVIGNAGVANVDLVIAPGGGGALQNGADAVVLFTGDIVDFPNDTAPPTGAAVLDVVHYGTNDSADPDITAIYPLSMYPYVDEGTLGDKDTDSVGRIPNGMGGPFQTLDNPSPGALNVVPEPSPFFMLGLALLGFIGFTGRK